MKARKKASSISINTSQYSKVDINAELDLFVKSVEETLREEHELMSAKLVQSQLVRLGTNQTGFSFTKDHPYSSQRSSNESQSLAESPMIKRRSPNKS